MQQPTAFEIGKTGDLTECLATDNWEVLAGAARHGHIEVVRILVKLHSNWRDTALIEASAGGHLPIVRELLDARPFVVYALNEALTKACMNSHIGVANALINAPVVSAHPIFGVQGAVIAGSHTMYNLMLEDKRCIAEMSPHLAKLILQVHDSHEKLCARVPTGDCGHRRILEDLVHKLETAHT